MKKTFLALLAIILATPGFSANQPLKLFPSDLVLCGPSGICRFNTPFWDRSWGKDVLIQVSGVQLPSWPSRCQAATLLSNLAVEAMEDKIRKASFIEITDLGEAPPFELTPGKSRSVRKGRIVLDGADLGKTLLDLRLGIPEQAKDQKDSAHKDIWCEP